jgi:hypothetical protein
MKKKCPKCGKMFVLGTEGLSDPLGCDVCLGVERISDIASDHSAWERGEEYHDYYNPETGLITRVTREQAREQARAK